MLLLRDGEVVLLATKVYKGEGWALDTIKFLSLLKVGKYNKPPLKGNSLKLIGSAKYTLLTGWHRRLAHLYIKDIKRLATILEGLDI